ncbi:hypothetical protein AHAT_12740 [Agarivorans sp. Toyoura001]|uniref:DUF3299 domain-containing protein n=1 Tax=Agarivorans sp. Toyoura001 TaxID=2283141 RepID=UPI0010D54B36|nr:DUF3299 domain-containing protein [Agarivorans sp. Toyoura001]GDY25384.1 hypothetical protein AHAT_12740 [Agarivorans sp. Toyoura001]
MLRILCFVFAGLISPIVLATPNPWLSLVPELERDQPNQNPINHQIQLDERAPQIKSGGLVQALNGQDMRMPGFVVPLESDGDKITEFFLVPFFGACLHLPPPPPNQIIHVRHPAGIDMVEPWEVIWISGQMQVKATDVEGIASAGYAMSLNKDIEFYVP